MREKKAARIWGIGIAAGLLAACSSKEGKTALEPKPPVDPGKTLSKVDSLLKNNKGKGIVSGYLTGEGKSTAQALLKQASNAAGERRYLTRNEEPLRGASILLFDALKPTTAPETTLTTDSTGAYTAVLREGKYFGFAVHLDLKTFQLVTAAIPDINPVADKAMTVDTATALEDVTAPTLLGVFDATVPNSDNIFLMGSIPAENAKINIGFSEPMQRESVKGITVGRVDTANAGGSLVLADTLKAAEYSLTWNGDNRELTLGIARLEEGVQYGIILPTSLKDLAKNSMEKQYGATFVAVAASKVKAVPFALEATFPQEGEGLRPNQKPVLTFNRPVEIFSALRGIRIEPRLEGYWEVTGPKLTLITKANLAVGQTYKVTVADSVKDLFGARLGKTLAFNFKVDDFEGATKEKSGREKEVALLVEEFFNSYLQGDLGRFSAFIHANFRMEGEGRLLSRQQFLDMIRTEAGEKNKLLGGFPAPVFKRDAKLCQGSEGRPQSLFWKVASVDRAETLWVETQVGFGVTPKVLRGDAEVTAGISWDRGSPSFTLNGRKFIYQVDFSRLSGPINAENAQRDPSFFGEQLRQNSSVVVEPLKDAIKEKFVIDGGIKVSNDTGYVAVKAVTTRGFGRPDGDPERLCGKAVADTSYEILKFILLAEGSKWLVAHVSQEEGVDRQKFNQNVNAGEFKVTAIAPLALVAPVDGQANAADAEGKVTFRFKGADHDSVGGYLVGIAEEGRFVGNRAPNGALLFVKAQGKGAEHRFSLSAKGQAGDGATALLRDVNSLGLPGWERVAFRGTLQDLFDIQKGIAGVYAWKVIAVRDTSAAQFLLNGFSPARFFAESDFGMRRGFFAVKGFPNESDFKRIESQVNPPPQGPGAPMGFEDRDLDGFPDFIEITFKTKVDDRTSYPNFQVDTDGDGLADFLEKMIDASGAAVEKKATEEEKKAAIEALVKLGIRWNDQDGDGFPDEIEQLLGFNPQDRASNPGTRARASVPTGVFSAVLRMGDRSSTLKFRILADSNVRVSYEAHLQDTLADTVKAFFNEAIGEFIFPVLLPAGGPDAGKALLFRGRYDATRGFLEGPVDRIDHSDRASNRFGSGPYAGQFAASSRGEDLSRYAGGAPGMPGPGAPVTGPGMPPPQPPQGGYRRPPAGVEARARILLMARQGQGTLGVIDEFGDTVVAKARLDMRQQADGGFEFRAVADTSDAAASYKMVLNIHGRIFKTRDSVSEVWVMDGGFNTDIDSCKRLDPNTRACLERLHKNVPGQFSAKVPAAQFSHGPTETQAVFTGWLQEDRFGTGFPGGPVPGPVVNPNPGAPAPVNPPPPTGGSFARPYIGGQVRFMEYLKRMNIAEGDSLYITTGNRVMWVKADSLHIRKTDFPLCGGIALKPALIAPLAEADLAVKESYRRDSLLLNDPRAQVIVIEDASDFGRPGTVDKARDVRGNIRVNLVVVEVRGVALSPANTCPVDGQPGGPVVGPAPGPLPPRDTTVTGPVPPPPPRDTTQVGGTPTNPPPGGTPPPGGNPPPGGTLPPPPFFRGLVDEAKTALERSGGNCLLEKAPGSNAPFLADPATVRLDGEFVVVQDKERRGTFFFMAQKDNPRALLLLEGKVLLKEKLQMAAAPN